MNKFHKISFTTIVGVLILVVTNFSQVLEKRNDSEAYNCKELQKFFLDTLVSAKKPGGLIVIKNSCSENIFVSEYKPEELSLDEKLNLITQLNPKYAWKYEQGIINLAPTKSIPELLNIKVKNFNVSNIYNLDLVIDKILQLPEVLAISKKLNLQQETQFGGLQSPPTKRLPLEMVFKDKTLQQILNEIVEKRGRGVWVYSESNYNGVDTFTLDFLVR